MNGENQMSPEILDNLDSLTIRVTDSRTVLDKYRELVEEGALQDPTGILDELALGLLLQTKETVTLINSLIPDDASVKISS